MQEEIEVWKPVLNCKTHEVSSLGRVRHINGRISKLHKGTGNGGYLIFRRPHLNYGKTVHRMVAESFIEKPIGKDEINHINGNKYDNSVTNLEWCTRTENMRHARDTGLKINGPVRRIFDKIQSVVIQDCFNAGFTNVAISKYFKCHQSTIAYIRYGKRKCYSS